jgi:hypothetical protein
LHSMSENLSNRVDEIDRFILSNKSSEVLFIDIYNSLKNVQ